MYRICEKCVCFVFLVILAVLSCSGFRIDNLAMTDISKRNSVHNTSSSSAYSDEVFAKLFGAPPQRHRLRHHRQLRAHSHTSRLIEPRVTSPPNDEFPQIPPSDVRPLAPTAPLMRSQRSKNRKHQRSACQDYDISWKTYKADTVVIANVQSMSSDRRDNFTVIFKVFKRMKEDRAFRVDGPILSLTFYNNRTATNCDFDESRGSHFLVRPKIEQSKEYVLFLNRTGAHNFSAIFAPELKKKKKMAVVHRVTRPNFRPQPVKLSIKDVTLKENRTERNTMKLVCKIKGFPIPVVHWRRNNTTLHPSHRVKITHKKRRSVLVIYNTTEADSGDYQCRTRDVENQEVVKSLKIFRNDPLSFREPCNLAMAVDFCANKGKCYYLKSMNEYMCECENGFVGKQCQEKSSDQSSMYRQTPMYTCKLGLYTKYDNC